MPEQSHKPLISIAMPVYNHGKFIAMALDSVLMQKTDFDYEIVIGDDCSTDNTRDILLSYKAQHSQKITLLLAEKNRGVFENAYGIYKNCRGRYIAERANLYSFQPGQ